MTSSLTRTHGAPMLDLAAVAEVLGISRRHLDDVRNDDPSFPAPRMLGRLPRWTYDSIRSWVEAASAAEEGSPASECKCSAEKTAAPRKAKAKAKKGAGHVL